MSVRLTEVRKPLYTAVVAVEKAIFTPPISGQGILASVDVTTHIPLIIKPSDGLGRQRVFVSLSLTVRGCRVSSC